MPDGALSDVQTWVTLVYELTYIDPVDPPLVNFDGDIMPCSLSSEKESFFRDQILPIFARDRIPDCISSFEREHPWLLEFNHQHREGFTSTMRRLQQDPLDVPDILSAYIRLQDFARIKRGMIDSLEKNACSTLDFDRRHVILDLSADDVYTVYSHFRHFRLQSPLEVGHDPYRTVDWAKWETIIKNMREFGNMLPHVQGTYKLNSWDSWTDCIESLRTKTTALSLSSNVIGRELQRTIEDLKRKNSDQERQIREYRSIVSDLSFRHLMEMLPIAAKAAGKELQASPGHTTQKAVQGAHSHETSDNNSTRPSQSSKSKKSTKKGKQPQTQQHKHQDTPPRNPQKLAPQWQDFWKTAWLKATDGKTGKLNDL